MSALPNTCSGMHGHCQNHHIYLLFPLSFPFPSFPSLLFLSFPHLYSPHHPQSCQPCILVYMVYYIYYPCAVLTPSLIGYSCSLPSHLSFSLTLVYLLYIRTIHSKGMRGNLLLSDPLP